MYFLTYVAFVLMSALYFGYAKAFENAALYWSKRLTALDDGLPLEIHRFLTPRGQGVRDMMLLWVTLVGLTAGLSFLNVFVVTLFFFVLFALRHVTWRLFPREDAVFFFKVILRGLEKRATRLKSKGDSEDLRLVQQCIAGFNKVATSS